MGRQMQTKCSELHRSIDGRSHYNWLKNIKDNRTSFDVEQQEIQLRTSHSVCWGPRIHSGHVAHADIGLNLKFSLLWGRYCSRESHYEKITTDIHSES